MPARPNQGGSPGTWGTELDAYLDVSIDPTTGNLKTAAVRAALQGVFSYNPKDYGASAGASDNSAAIIAADAAAAAATPKGVVFFSELYPTTAAVTVSAGVLWKGVGPSSGIICQNTTADPNTGNKSAVKPARGSGAAIADMKIDGASTTQVGLELSGYNDGQMQRGTFSNVTITGCTQAGVKIQGGYRMTFEYCDIHHNQIGVWVPSTLYLTSLGQYDFNSTWVHDNTAEGVYMQAGSIFNWFGGNVENNGTYGYHFDPAASGLLLSSIGIFGVNIEANATMGLLAHDFTQGITAIGNSFISSSIQPQAFQLDGAGGGNHWFANNFHQGHATGSVINSPNSYVFPGRMLSEPAMTGTYPPEQGRNIVTLTYGATIATDASQGSQFVIAPTNGTAFTISSPTRPGTGQTISYEIRNTSGGALGAITWGAAFLLAGAFTSPANTKRRTITFRYDGTNWVELSRATADI